MKLAITAASLQVSGHLGPVCIACGNSKEFWVHTRDGDRLVQLADLPEGEVRLTACGKCRARNSIVVARVD